MFITDHKTVSSVCGYEPIIPPVTSQNVADQCDLPANLSVKRWYGSVGLAHVRIVVADLAAPSRSCRFYHLHVVKTIHLHPFILGIRHCPLMGRILPPTFPGTKRLTWRPSQLNLALKSRWCFGALRWVCHGTCTPPYRSSQTTIVFRWLSSQTILTRISLWGNIGRYTFPSLFLFPPHLLFMINAQPPDSDGSWTLCGSGDSQTRGSSNSRLLIAAATWT